MTASHPSVGIRQTVHPGGAYRVTREARLKDPNWLGRVRETLDDLPEWVWEERTVSSSPDGTVVVRWADWVTIEVEEARLEEL